MKLTEVTDESKCCCSCRNNKRSKGGKFGGILCHCEKDGHYIGYIQNFEQVCEEWEKDGEQD